MLRGVDFMTKIYNGTYKIIVWSLGVVFVVFYPTLFSMTPSGQPDDHKRTAHSDSSEFFAKPVVRGEEKSSRLDHDVYPINFVCFGALQFFMTHIHNKDVLKAIVRGIKNCPDRVIKLLFFCIDCQKTNLFNPNLIRGIEAFITNKLPRLDLRYLTFRWSVTRMPMFAVLDVPTNISRDIYEPDFRDRFDDAFRAMNYKKSDQDDKQDNKIDAYYSDNEENGDLVDEDFYADFQRGLAIDEKAENCPDYAQVAEGSILLQSLIKNYAKFRHNRQPEVQRVMNRVRFEALSFFVKIIKNKRVLNEIIKSIKYFPDKVIKLYFYCLEYYYINLLNDKLIRLIEAFILTNINFHAERFSLRFLSFWRNSKGLPEVEMRMYGGGDGDMYDDISDTQTPVPADTSICIIS